MSQQSSRSVICPRQWSYVVCCFDVFAERLLNLSVVIQNQEQMKNDQEHSLNLPNHELHLSSKPFRQEWQ